jgi:hypothetical protein
VSGALPNIAFWILYRPVLAIQRRQVRPSFREHHSLISSGALQEDRIFLPCWLSVLKIYRPTSLIAISNSLLQTARLLTYF